MRKKQEEEDEEQRERVLAASKFDRTFSNLWWLWPQVNFVFLIFGGFGRHKT
jgi:hypothetical protein